MTGAAALGALVGAACGGDGGGDVARAPAGDEQAVRGQAIFEDDCASCHSTTGSSGTGPHLDGIHGQEVELSDGSTVTVDDEYLARSMRDPTADVVDGFQPVMPDLGLSDDEVEALVAYVRSLE